MSRTGQRSPSSSTSTTSAPRARLLAGFDMFRNAGESLDEVIRKAREAGKRILPIGSGWALSKINITDGWLVNTKLLNGCYDIGDRYFDADLSGRGPPVRRARPGRHADRRAQRVSRADAAGRCQEAGAEGGRDRQRPDHRRRGLREHPRLADQFRGDARLRRRPAHRHRQRPDLVDREGVEARAQRGLRRRGSAPS